MHDLFDANILNGSKSFKSGSSHRRYQYQQDKPSASRMKSESQNEIKQSRVDFKKSNVSKNTNRLQTERKNVHEIGDKNAGNYDINNNNQRETRYNNLQKHEGKPINKMKNDMLDNNQRKVKQSEELPKKSYFLNRRKEKQKDYNLEQHRENGIDPRNNYEMINYSNKNSKNVKQQKSISSSKSELIGLKNLCDDESDLINLTKSLSFSNSKYKQSEVHAQNNRFAHFDDYKIQHQPGKSLKRF